MTPLLITLQNLLAESSPPPANGVGQAGKAVGGGQAVGGGLPNLGSGTAPPGAEKITLILQWGLWAVTIACVGGVLFSAGKMALNHRNGGGGGEAMTGLIWVLVASVIAGSATSIIALLI
jgi:hypothetical protein